MLHPWVYFVRFFQPLTHLRVFKLLRKKRWSPLYPTLNDFIAVRLTDTPLIFSLHRHHVTQLYTGAYPRVETAFRSWNFHYIFLWQISRLSTGVGLWLHRTSLTLTTRLDLFKRFDWHRSFTLLSTISFICEFPDFYQWLSAIIISFGNQVINAIEDRLILILLSSDSSQLV